MPTPEEEQRPSYDYVVRSYGHELPSEAVLELRRLALRNHAELISSAAYYDEALEEHFRETRPTGLQSYLGKEHFWYIGELAGLSRRTSGKLFTNIVYPLTEDGSSVLIPSIDLDLNVIPRTDAGLPTPPNPGSLEVSVERSRQRKLHIESPLGTHISDSQIAVQVRGVTELPTEPNRLKSMFGMGAKAVESLTDFNKMLFDIMFA